MAHSPATRPDPFAPREPEEVRASAETGKAPTQSFSKYVHALADSGGGSVSVDVALDLVLNEILEAACAATAAQAGAIALERDGKMICRASAGENAPELGSRLNMSDGLSGASVRSGEWQHCGDTENDERVDAAICRRLGVRSILVVPVLQGDTAIGVIEVFSIRPKVFGEREIQVLQEFSRQINQNVEDAAAMQNPNPDPSPHAESRDPVTPPEQAVAAMPETGAKAGDFSTAALLICVILLALVLGWEIGRDQRRAPTTRSPAQSSTVVSQSSGGPSTRAVAEAPTNQERPAPPVTSKPTENAGEENDGLVISRNGQVIFRASEPEVSEPVAPAVSAGKPPLRIPPDIAAEYISARVEPEYPAEARKRRIQGSVQLDALVGKDGAVRRTTVISGNPQLVGAASHAVQQWRFQPFLRDNQPEDFITRVTVDFRLP
jgi:TonB family protein